VASIALLSWRVLVFGCLIEVVVVANTVIQLIPVDPSLQTNVDYASMAEYIINGTYYVLDNLAQIVYEWSQNTPGPNNTITNTGGSYSQFLAFLASNPPVVQTNNASYPSATIIAPEQTVLLRGILLALIELATSGGQSDPRDYYPLNTALS
jgi:hypothetical protein